MPLKTSFVAGGAALCLMALAACNKPAAPAAPSVAAPPATAPAAPPAATPYVPAPVPGVAPGPAPQAAPPTMAAPAPMTSAAPMGRGRRGGGMGGGGRRAILMQACAADIAKFCPGSDKPGKCLKPHKAELSASCQAARAQLKAQRANRNGGEAAE